MWPSHAAGKKHGTPKREDLHRAWQQTSYRVRGLVENTGRFGQMHPNGVAQLAGDKGPTDVNV